MRLQTHSLLLSVFIFLFLLTACRNEPKLPTVAVDTVVDIRFPSEPRGLNYLLNYDAPAIRVMRQLSLPLTDFNPTTYKAEPILIKNLPIKKEITEGPDAGLIAYTFDLLEEAVWDDGTPITVKDFLFTMKAIYNPHYNSPYVGEFLRIKKVETDPASPKKFTIYSEKYLLLEATIGNFTLLPAHVLDPENVYENYPLMDLMNPANKERYTADEQLKTVAALFTAAKNRGQDGMTPGSGPYKLEAWTTGESLVLVKKDNWWGDAISNKYPRLQAKAKKIVFKIIPDFNATVSLMRNGEIDLASNVEVREINKLKKDPFFKENFNFHEPSMYRHNFIMMNTASPKMSDKKVRRALAHLADLNEIYKAVYMGENNPVVGPIHPSKPYYHKDLPIIDYNVEKAKALLTEAGWTDSNNNGTVDKVIDGELTELSLKYSYSGASKNAGDIGQLLKEAAQPAGVNIEVVPMEGRPLQMGWRQKNFELSTLGSAWYPFHKDPHQRWHSEGASNYFSFGNAESDELIKTIQGTVDEEKLPALYKRFQEIVYEEQPVIFINTAVNHIMVHKKFGNIRTTSISPGYLVNELAEQNVPININNN